MLVENWSVDDVCDFFNNHPSCRKKDYVKELIKKYNINGKFLLTLYASDFTELNIESTLDAKRIYFDIHNYEERKENKYKKGNYFVVGIENGIALYNVKTGKQLKTFEYDDIDCVTTIAVSGNGQHIAIASEYIKIISLENDSVKNFDEKHIDDIICMQFSPDGKRLASGSRDETIIIWDVETGTCLNTYSGHTKTVRSVDWTSDGKYIISGSDDRTIKILNSTTMDEIKNIKTNGSVFKACITPDNKNVISFSISDKLMITKWSMDSGECLIKTRLDTVAADIAVFPNGESLAISSFQGSIFVLSIKDLSRKYVIYRDETVSSNIAITNDGKYIISGDNNGFINIFSINGDFINKLKLGTYPFVFT